jgi:hypothetical protein
MFSEVSQVQKDKGHMFSLILRDKHIHENKHDRIQTHM